MISVHFFLRRVRRRTLGVCFVCGGEDVGVVFDGHGDGLLFGEERERGRRGVSL